MKCVTSVSILRPGKSLIVKGDSMSQTLQYKGYDGSVEYSAEDRILLGSLLGIRDAIVYEGTDVDSLEANFRAAVDEYLAFCVGEGKIPDQPFDGFSETKFVVDCAT